MSGVQYARYEQKALSLSWEVAYAMACAKFGKDRVDALPRISRGPRKGQLKGFYCYTKCTVGGWVTEKQRVMRPGSFDYFLSLTAGDDRAPIAWFSEHAGRAMWAEDLAREEAERVALAPVREAVKAALEECTRADRPHSVMLDRDGGRIENVPMHWALIEALHFDTEREFSPFPRRVAA